MFGHGDAVHYRELSDDAVTTAVPMRVISDNPDAACCISLPAPRSAAPVHPLVGRFAT